MFNTVKRSFSSTVGVLFAVISVILVMALIALSTAYMHDYVVSRTYSNKPSMNEDNQWGSLLVSVSITKNERIDAMAARTASCYIPPSKGGRINWQETLSDHTYLGLNTSDPSCTYSVPGNPGSSRIAGTLRIKNRLWLKSIRVPDSILKASFGSKVTSTSAPGLDGKVLGPGKGASIEYEASFGAPLEGRVVLSANGKHYELH